VKKRQKKLVLFVVLGIIAIFMASLITRGPDNIDNVRVLALRTDDPSEYSFDVFNNTSRNLAIAGTPRLEQEIYGEWHLVKEITDLASFYVNAGARETYSATWELPRGRYRIIMPFQCRRNSSLQVEAVERFSVTEQLDLDIAMHVLQDSISPWGAAFLVTNNSGFNLESFSGFIIETYQDGKWSTCWEGSSDSPAVSLQDSEQIVTAYTWVPRAIGDFPTRIVKTFRHVGSNYIIWDRVYAEFTSQPREIEDVGITMEVTGRARDGLNLLITNSTGYYAVFNNTVMRDRTCCCTSFNSPFTIVQNIDGRWTAFGGYGHQSANGFELEPNSYLELELRTGNIDPGEFRIEKSFSIGLENPDTARTMGVQAEFAIEDTTINEEMYGIHMGVRRIINPRVAMFQLTNAFQEGSIYFSRDYILQKYTNGAWLDMPELAPGSMLDGEQFLGARQQRLIIKYWGWLYGELETGRYRIVKTFWHRTSDGAQTQYEAHVEVDIINRTYYLGINGGIIYLAEVLRDEHKPRTLARSRLLLYGLSPDESDRPRHRHSSSYNNRYSNRQFNLFENAYAVVFDASGQQILFSDIPKGAIVEIISSQVSPYGTISIQIVEDYS